MYSKLEDNSDAFSKKLFLYHLKPAENQSGGEKADDE